MRHSSPTSLSVILPAYNEAGSIVELINAILRYAPPDAEVLLVDDDSPDGTARRASEAFRGSDRVRVTVRSRDRGLARSVRAGIEAARSDRVLIMDSDFNHDPRDIPRLIGVAAFADIVIGSRFAPGGNMPDRARYLGSLVYNLFVRMALRTQVQDNLSGYFVIRRNAVLSLPLDEIFFGFGDYFFRLLHFAQRSGFSIIEVPVVYGTRDSGHPKHSVFKTFFQYTGSLLRFRSRLQASGRAAPARRRSSVDVRIPLDAVQPEPPVET